MPPNTTELFKRLLQRDFGDDLFLPPMPIITPPAPEAPPIARKELLANYILTHTSGNKDAAAFMSGDLSERAGAKTEEPSFLSKLFDLASTPLYASTNIISNFLDDQGNVVEDIASIPKEIAGAGARIIDKSMPALPITTPFWLVDKIAETVAPGDPFHELSKETQPKFTSDILEEQGVENKFAKYGLGFVGDVLLDPLTYIPGANLAKVARAGRRDALEQITRQAAITPTESAFVKSMIPDVPKIDLGLNVPTADVALGSARDITQPGIRRSLMPEMAPTPPAEHFQRLSDLAGAPDLRSPEISSILRSEQARHAALKRHYPDPKYWDEFDNLIPRQSMVDRQAFVDYMKEAKLKKSGKVTDAKGNISAQSVGDLLGRLSRGDIPNFAPKVANATGDSAYQARIEADRFLDQMLTKYKGQKKPANFSPVAQVNLYNRLFNATAGLVSGNTGIKSVTGAKAIAWRRDETVKMLRSAEDHLIALGKMPEYWNGQQVRLSDILASIGPRATAKQYENVLADFLQRDMRKIVDPQVKQAVELALARRAMSTADLLTNLQQFAKRSRLDVEEITNPVARVKASREIDSNAKELAKRLGATGAESSAIKDAVRHVIDIDEIPDELVFEKFGPELARAVKAGKTNTQAIDGLTKEIERLANVKYEKLGNVVTGNRAVDLFMTRFTTWFGRTPELVHSKLDAFIWGQRNAEMRGEKFRNIIKHYNRQDINDAFLVAQGAKNAADNTKQAALAMEFKEYFNYMLGGSGLADEIGQAAVAVRMNAIMDDVNRALRRMGYGDFQFTNKKMVDRFGRERDFRPEAEGWLHSWEVAVPKDPAAFMYNMDLAFERVAKEYAMIDEFGARFGRSVRSGDFQNVVPHPRLEGKYFTQDIASSMTRLLEDMNENIWKPKGIMRWYSRALRAWKTGVTIYLPSHHIRNIIGDMHLMWWAGYNDPRSFIKSYRVLHSQRRHYKHVAREGTWEELNKLLDKNALDWASEGTDTIIRKRGFNITADQIYVSAHQRGMLLDANLLEDIFGEAPIPVQPFGGRVHGVAARTAEYREHFVRLAHYIAAIEKRINKGQKNLKTIFDDAAHEVRKWHPDGRDLTTFEQKARLMFPFYSWTRKAIPLVIQSFLTRPAKITYYPKMMLNLQGMAGIEDPSLLDPFPNDQLFPDWIRESGIGPVAESGMGGLPGIIADASREEPGLLGQDTGYTVVNPSNPFSDLVGQFVGMGGPQAPLRGTAEMLSPAIRIPAELAFDTTKITGVPIEADPAQYISENIPILAPLARVLNHSIIAGETKQGREEGNFDIEALINIMTAMGLRGTGPYEGQAEFEARERAIRRSRGN